MTLDSGTTGTCGLAIDRPCLHLVTVHGPAPYRPKGTAPREQLLLFEVNARRSGASDEF